MPVSKCTSTSAPGWLAQIWNLIAVILHKSSLYFILIKQSRAICEAITLPADVRHLWRGWSRGCAGVLHWLSGTAWEVTFVSASQFQNELWVSTLGQEVEQVCVCTLSVWNWFGSRQPQIDGTVPLSGFVTNSQRPHGSPSRLQLSCKQLSVSSRR